VGKGAVKRGECEERNGVCGNGVWCERLSAVKRGMWGSVN